MWVVGGEARKKGGFVGKRKMFQKLVYFLSVGAAV